MSLIQCKWHANNPVSSHENKVQLSKMAVQCHAYDWKRVSWELEIPIYSYIFYLRRRFWTVVLPVLCVLRKKTFCFGLWHLRCATPCVTLKIHLALLFYLFLENPRIATLQFYFPARDFGKISRSRKLIIWLSQLPIYPSRDLAPSQNNMQLTQRAQIAKSKLSTANKRNVDLRCDDTISKREKEQHFRLERSGGDSHLE